MVNRWMQPVRSAVAVVAFAWLAAWMVACAPLELEAPPPAPVGAPAAATPQERAAAPGAPLLAPWQTLSGGWRVTVPVAGAPIGAPLPPTGAPIGAPLPATQRLNFQLPVGVAMRGELLLVADAGWRQLYRLERGRDQLLPLGPYATVLAADHATSLQLTSDGSVWLAEPAAGRVIQLDAFGRLRRVLRDERMVSRPIAVVASEAPGDVFVADATDARIVVFEPFGRVVRQFGGGKLQSVAAMAAGPEGLYVVDRLAQQVVVFDVDGRVKRAFGEDSLVQPRAIAVDAAGRVFVADDADTTIKVFLGGQRIAIAGGPGTAPGRFGRIDALAVDGGLLAVADSTNARVQLLLVSPESVRNPGRAQR